MFICLYLVTTPPTLPTSPCFIQFLGRALIWDVSCKLFACVWLGIRWYHSPMLIHQCYPNHCHTDLLFFESLWYSWELMWHIHRLEMTKNHQLQLWDGNDDSQCSLLLTILVISLSCSPPLSLPPSFSQLVASMDAQPSRYSATVRVQQHRQVVFYTFHSLLHLGILFAQPLHSFSCLHAI